MREPADAGPAAVPVEERLRYQGEVFINFRNHTYQWVSLKLFALPADVDDYTVLRLLIGHIRYRDSYGGTGDKDMETIHGPYWLYAIAPEVFSPVSAIDAETLIRTWAEYAAPLPDGRRDEMERELYPRIRNATSRYQLPDLRDAAEHDWGGSVGAVTGFFEFVLIDRRAGSVALVIASDD
ncbi:hypothetical protein [Mycobacterium parmense]|uniref:Uncharacterized protein n=1 Tax=Mycobacterium parmense TaxID=185642 RepID=A0A7I7YVL9_9MYCO|nr:hypothetical protein [Mycobacterium parmense]MCV7350723.1 hypothetical protein [Mycobacterium parmense]ORW48416.1 hypothetical protein AWC20_26190 [Mycobacterium parmense]BBZ45850.1 hypothetical protein MPRM_31310 [Mycobacterium parmense]